MPELPQIHVFNSMPFNGQGHSQTCYNICKHWPSFGAATTIHTTVLLRNDPQSIIKSVIPRNLPVRLRYQIYDAIGHQRLRHRGQSNGLKRVKPGDICYFWPNSSSDALRRARALGAIVVVEFINTHVGLVERIMDAERSLYALGENPDRERLFFEEEDRLKLADFAFAPGPFVGSSIREFSNTNVGLLETSYGTHYPEDLPEKNKPDRVRFVFVGSFGLRKGARALIAAWDMAGLDADLHIFGSIDPMFEEEIKRLKSSNVFFRGYFRNIADAYRGADVFVFPSLEEGGPQVTYEAAGHAIPLIVTPMGGGRVADKSNSIVVEPGDPKALANALTRLAQDSALRARLGAAARVSAARYDWEKVAHQRLTLLMEAVGAPAPDPLRTSMAKAQIKSGTVTESA